MPVGPKFHPDHKFQDTLKRLEKSFALAVKTPSGVASVYNKFATDVVLNGTDLTYPVAHMLGTEDVLVQAKNEATNEVVDIVWHTVNPYSILITYATPPGAMTLRVVVFG